MFTGISVQLRRLIIAGMLLNILTASCNPLSRVSKNVDTGPGPDETEVQTAVLSPGKAKQEIRVTPLLEEDYLTNPGIGWQDGPEQHDPLNFPETVAYANRRDIAWSELNPEKGVYRWDALDQQLRSAVEAGKQYSFRIYTVVGEGFDGSKVPQWIVEEGAQILATGDPDYGNCTYQEKWGEFVNELAQVYDGNANIAFIDISGYGNFNEWNWNDHQTEWDSQWETDHARGNPSMASFRTIDGQARRRLVDMFIGGSFNGHACRMADGTIASVNYSYPGFQKTQLLMPYAGIIQSTQYVRSRRVDVGFRYDCLGRESQLLYDKIGDEIVSVWRDAPVVYELCKPEETDLNDATWLLQKTHASIVHNNRWNYSVEQLEALMLPAGYRYYLRNFQLNISERQVNMEMEWQNLGLARNYPKMGQDFQLYFYLVDDAGRVAFQDPIPADISTWLPADPYPGEPPGYRISHSAQIPSILKAGTYMVGVGILELRTGNPIQLAFAGKGSSGVYLLFAMDVE